MISDRLAIVPGLPGGAFRNLSVQFELAGNDRLREVTLADEIRNDANIFDFLGIKEKDRVPQPRLFFPKRAGHFTKNVSSSDLGRMRQRGRARIRIHRRAMTDDKERAVRLRSHTRSENVQRSTLNVQCSIEC